ncbi:MAG: GerMN domain-containing protein [Oscillospiraceae bacterium]|nr:GerMN domain-containing protein [Oscillospiraceae bacterium]
MNKKKLLKTAIPAALILLVIIIVLAYINYDRTTPKAEVDLYFLNSDGTGIVAEQRAVRYHDDREKVKNTLERLKKGPSNPKKGSVIAKGTEINSITFEEPDRVIVDFSNSFLTGDPAKDVLNTYAVVKTLCSTGCVTAVEVTVNGNLIQDRDGNSFEFISASDINLETEEYSSEMKDVVLYFADKSGKQLVREERNIKITDLRPVEEYIINELIKGTNTGSLQSLLSKKTTLISVDIENNICYLNFKSDFIKNNSGSAEHERLVIYSIVNSLTEMSNIARVQFYMDGKRVDKFGSVDIKNFISRDTDIIKN